MTDPRWDTYIAVIRHELLQEHEIRSRVLVAGLHNLIGASGSHTQGLAGGGVDSGGQALTRRILGLVFTVVAATVVVQVILKGDLVLAGHRVGLQCQLQVANVVDDMLDDLELGQLSVLRHERHQVLQLGQVHLNLDILTVGSPVAGSGVADTAIDDCWGHGGSTGRAKGTQGFHFVNGFFAGPRQLFKYFFRADALNSFWDLFWTRPRNAANLIIFHCLTRVHTLIHVVLEGVEHRFI